MCGWPISLHKSEAYIPFDRQSELAKLRTIDRKMLVSVLLSRVLLGPFDSGHKTFQPAQQDKQALSAEQQPILSIRPTCRRYRKHAIDRKSQSAGSLVG